MEVTIRDERPADAATIGAINDAAFKPMPYSDGSEAAIVEALRAGGALTVSLVAERDGEVVGHVAFSPVKIDGESGSWFGLGPVSVRPDLQGKGAGSALIREGLSRLEALGADACVVLGNPAYYGRFGFTHDPTLTYPTPYAQAFQRLVLKGPAPKGAVTYHPAFG
jgi:putative acetyltransferase